MEATAVTMVYRGTNMSLEERIKEQGERVRKLKAEKAPKEQVGVKVVVLVR